MPKRMSEKERRVLIQAVIIRDGDICKLCHETPVRAKTLDHVNGKPRDNRPENLVLLCRPCNTAEGNRARRGCRLLTPSTLAEFSAAAHETLVNTSSGRALPDQSVARVTCESERVRDGAGIDRRGWGPSEEAANLVMEPTYRLWLYRWVKQHGYISRQDAIDAGAEYLDQTVGRASQQTIERYFRKAISSAGWLEERRGESSEPVWGFRIGVSLDAIEALLEKRMRAIGPRLAECAAS